MDIKSTLQFVGVETTERNATTNAVISSGVRLVTSAQKQRSYDEYAKRRKPLILQLNPTAQRQIGSTNLYGVLSYTTRVFKPGFGVSRFYTVENDIWRDTQYGPLGLYTLEKIYGRPTATPTGSDKAYKIWPNVERRQAAETDLLIKLKQRYEGPGTPSGSLAESVAEIDKTGEWFYDRVKSISHAISGVWKKDWNQVREGVQGAYAQRTLLSFDAKTGRMRRGAPKKVAGFDKRPLPKREPPGWSTRDVSDRYFEVHFALSPVLSDVALGAVEVGKLFEAFAKMTKYTGRDVVSVNHERTLVPTYWPVGSGAGTGKSPSCKVRFETLDAVKVTAIYQLEDDFAARLAHAGIAVSSLAVIAHARTPFSWLLDWSVGIGDYLEAMNADAGMRFVTGWDVHVIELKKVEFYDFQNGDAYNVTQVRSPAWKSRSVVRSVRTSSPRPYTVVKSPLSSDHAITALALVRGMLPKRLFK